jgi:hypothetical protein
MIEKGTTFGEASEGTIENCARVIYALEATTRITKELTNQKMNQNQNTNKPSNQTEWRAVA